jgi:hypothetical protein
VFCPRCGAPNEKGDRFCAACGTTLPGADEQPQESRSFASRVKNIVGGTRRARLVTLATVLALLVAAIAFIAIKPSEGEVVIPRDAYTIAADHTCVQAKKSIAVSERQSVEEAQKTGDAGPGAFAQALVPIVIRWRTQMSELHVPADRTELATALDAALREVEVEIATLARVAQEGDQEATVERAEQVDEVTARVESAVSGLGLTNCAALSLGVAPSANG